MSWKALLPLRLRESPAWLTLRTIRADGWRLTARRWRTWPRILSTRPIVTPRVGAPAAAEVHLMCFEGDYLAAIWALKSFYAAAGVIYPLIIHLQGQMSRRARQRLATHFPVADIVTQADANERVEPMLAGRGLTRLHNARRASPMIMKLADFALLGQAAHVLAMDSDVLFFRRPEELVLANGASAPGSWFMHDIGSSYNISPERALTDLGIRLEPRVNCGIMFFRRDSLRLERCDELLAHPDVARVGGLIEQTLQALCASEDGRVRFLPDSYLISLDGRVNLDRVIVRHYAGPSRTLLTEEGMPRLVHDGLFERLAGL